MSPPERPGLVAGMVLLPRALQMLRRQRRLWPWCVLPFCLNLLAFAAAIVLLSSQFGVISDPISEWLSPRDPAAWYEWAWIGPLRLLAGLVRWFLLALLAVLVYFTFTLVGGVLASPFLDLLSRRVEEIATGAEPPDPGLAATFRIAFEELKRALFFLGVEAAILAMGLVPGLQLLAGAASIGFAVLFLPLNYAGYALDRRQLSFAARRAWIKRRPSLVAGFGGAAFVTFLIPGLNFLCLPWLVTAGTLLVLEAGPDGDIGG